MEEFNYQKRDVQGSSVDNINRNQCHEKKNISLSLHE